MIRAIWMVIVYAKQMFKLTFFAHVGIMILQKDMGKVNMIKEYMTVREAAEKWKITIRAVQLMCTNKRIDGVVKFGKSWAIPINVERPADGRVISGQYRNWRKNSKT